MQHYLQQIITGEKLNFIYKVVNRTTTYATNVEYIAKHRNLSNEDSKW